MKRIKLIWVIAAIFIMIPVKLMASSVWTGNGESHVELYKEPWGVTADRIAKVDNPGEVYSIEDLDTYSAYITNNPELLGKSIEEAFWWYKKSRVAYVKLINVEGVSRVSFLFEKKLYLYCAQFDSQFGMVDDGLWMTTGDVCNILPQTKWIMVVFRKVNGDLSTGSGNDDLIEVDDINKSNYRYLIFKPFTYTFNLNGGEYKGYTGTYTQERLGVENMTLPVPDRKGYTFAGWKSSQGQIYSGTLKPEYDSRLFGNEQFTAVWTENMPETVELDTDYVILEQNSSEVKQIKAKVGPSEIPDKTVIWKSSDDNIAKVDEYGNITAGNSGIAVITATTKNGLEAECKVYVMGFAISVPAYCTLNRTYAIKIDIYNNGSARMNGRKRVIVDADNSSVVRRQGDESTQYNVLAECAGSYNGQYKRLDSGDYLADTVESTTVYYRLKPETEITRAGDYTGSVNFSVMVR